jgi:hypothetical protein
VPHKPKPKPKPNFFLLLQWANLIGPSPQKKKKKKLKLWRLPPPQKIEDSMERRSASPLWPTCIGEKGRNFGQNIWVWGFIWLYNTNTIKSLILSRVHMVEYFELCFWGHKISQGISKNGMSKTQTLHYLTFFQNAPCHFPGPLPPPTIPDAITRTK